MKARSGSAGQNSERWLIYIPGNRWDDVSGTDHQLVSAIGRFRPVLWVDPAFSPARAFRAIGRPSGRLTEVAPGVTRLQTYGVPGASRPVLRTIARWLGPFRLRRSVRGLGMQVGGVVVASAQGVFPDLPGVPRMLFVTDDWVAGAELMGLSSHALARTIRANLSIAEVAAAVSPDLVDRVRSMAGSAGIVHLLPNGVTPLGGTGSEAVERNAHACLIGQLNERLDLEVLEALVEAGVPLRVVGPVAAKDPVTRDRIGTLLRRPGVTWVGRVPVDELAGHLARCSVGVTPYRDTEFNRSSFPLKTLEYLGAGLPVISSDLPSARWLDYDQVEIAARPDTFVNLVQERLAEPFDEAAAEGRIAYAERNSWLSRAEQLLQLLDQETVEELAPDPA